MSARALRCAIVALAAVAAILAFGTGFIQFAVPDNATAAGVIVGVGSAIAWAMASACGSSTWNNWFNLFAALFAALSLGYLTPNDSVCHESPHARAIYRADNGLLLGLACGLRPSGEDPLASQVQSLRRDLESVRRAINRVGQAAAQTDAEADATRRAQQADKSSIESEISDLAARVGRLEQAGRGAAPP